MWSRALLRSSFVTISAAVALIHVQVPLGTRTATRSPRMKWRSFSEQLLP